MSQAEVINEQYMDNYKAANELTMLIKVHAKYKASHMKGNSNGSY